VGEVQAGLRQLEIAFGPAELCFVRTGIDQEEEVALLHHRAFAKVYGLEVAADPGADLDRVDGFQPRRVLVPVGELTLHRMRHRDLRGRRRWRRRAVAGDEREQAQRGRERGGQDAGQSERTEPGGTKRLRKSRPDFASYICADEHCQVPVTDLASATAS